MEELLDIVNESDVVIGQETRAKVHKEQLMHRAVHIILTDASQRVFLQLRSKNKDTNPGLWDTSAAGHVDAGESYTDAAVRELHEELGVLIDVKELTQVARFSPTEQNGYEFTRIYVATSNEPITLEAGEIDDGRWLSESELDRLIDTQGDTITNTFKQIWRRYQDWMVSGTNGHT